MRKENIILQRATKVFGPKSMTLSIKGPKWLNITQTLYHVKEKC